MTDADLLELAATLAAEAAATIRTVRAAGFAIDQKRDRSPVTAADRLAEAVILDGLRRATPEIPVVAEEQVEAGKKPPADYASAADARWWLVDPLDGTREFAAGRAEYAVCIGLIVAGRPHLGVIAIPETQELFAGIVGQGAWKQHYNWPEADGPRTPILCRQPPPEGLTVMASRHYAQDPSLARYLEGKPVAKLFNQGSALKFCRVAEGAVDLYPRIGPTMEWDTAAGEALVVAAGGSVATPEGGLLPYGKPGWLNGPFVVRGAR